MKNAVLSLVLALLVMFSIAGVYAAGEITVNQAQPIKIAQKEAYLSIDELVSEQVLLINTASTSLSFKILSTELTHEDNADSKLNVSLASTTIDALKNKSVSLSYKTNSKTEAGMYGPVTLQVVNGSNTNQVFGSFDVLVFLPAVEITSIDIKDKETGLKDTKLEKGQKFTATVNYKNIASRTSLDNINIKIGFYENDDTELTTLVEDITGSDEDSEQEQDVDSSLSKGTTKSETFDFEMPYDISDTDPFTLFAEITAEADSNDISSEFYAKDTQEIEADVLVNAKLTMTQASASPSILACGVKRTKITAELINTGDDNAGDIQLFLRNTATSSEKQLTGNDEAIQADVVETEDDLLDPLEYFVDLTDLKAGQNTYSLVAYYDNGESSNVQAQKELTITSSCDATGANAGTTTTPAQNNSVVVIPTQTTTTTVPSTTTGSNTPYVKLKDVSGFSFDSDWVLPAVIGAGGLIVGVIIALLVIPRP